MLLTLLGIIGVIWNGVQGWHHSSPRGNVDTKRTKKEHVFIVGSALLTISVLLITGSTWLERLVTHTPTVLCWSYTKWPQHLPNCTLWGLTVVPAEPVKNLHLIISFARPIRDSVVLNGFEPGENFRIKAAPVVGPPCDLPGKPSARDDSLSFSISSNNRQIIVSGHDLTAYDTQSFIVSFYPDPNTGVPIQGIGVSGEATYEAFGHDLEAHIKLTKIKDGQVTGITEVN